MPILRNAALSLLFSPLLEPAHTNCLVGETVCQSKTSLNLKGNLYFPELPESYVKINVCQSLIKSLTQVLIILNAFYLLNQRILFC